MMSPAPTPSKPEGGERVPLHVELLTSAGIPVMAYPAWLTPQSVHQFGGYKVQGRGEGGPAAHPRRQAHGAGRRSPLFWRSCPRIWPKR